MRFSTTPSWKNLTLPHREPADGAAAPALDELGDLLLAAADVPLERAAHAQPKLAGAGQLLVGGLPAGIDKGVLAGGDPEPVVVRDTGPDSGHAIGVRRSRRTVEDEVHGLLLERPHGRAVLVALDPAAGRIGRRRRDPGRRERPRVDPDPVVVAVREHGRAVRHDGVERRRRRRAAGEVAHRPAAADDPLPVGVGVAVDGDTAQVLVGAAAALEAAQRRRVAARPEMAVRVLESGEHHPAVEVDDPRRRPPQPVHLVCVADGGDTPGLDRHGGGGAPGGVHRVHGRAAQDQIRGHARQMLDD